MSGRALPVELLGAALGIAAILLTLGVFVELEWARLAGAAMLTLASIDVSARLYAWSRRVQAEVGSGTRRMEQWEIRPPFLAIYLIMAAALAIGVTAEGREILAGLLLYPASVALMLLYVGRSRVAELVLELAFPTRTPPRPRPPQVP